MCRPLLFCSILLKVAQKTEKIIVGFLFNHANMSVPVVIKVKPNPSIRKLKQLVWMDAHAQRQLIRKNTAMKDQNLVIFQSSEMTQEFLI